MMSNKNVNYTKKEEHSIYILISQPQKIFLISHSRPESLKTTYRKNLAGERALSKDFISMVSPARPCIFELERIVASISDTYKHVLVWIKIFIENGYTCYNYATTIQQANDLFLENKRLYDERKKIDLKNILSCDKCLMPTFKNITCNNYNPNTANKSFVITENQNRRREHELRIKLHKEEYEFIKQKANEFNMQVSPYLRMIAQSPVVIRYNYAALDQHTKEIELVRQSINRLIFTIEASNNYLPREIEEIVRLMGLIFESENKLLRTLRKEREQTYEKYRRMYEKH